jgi:glucose-6-phosphate-specific signal transduction histidine kinase
MNTSKENVPNPAKQVPLKQIINSLLLSYQPVAVKQNSFFVNEIPAEIAVETDKNTLITLLGSLFYVVARSSRNTCIRISARVYENVLLLYVKDNSSASNYNTISSLQHLQLLAEKLGGFFHLSGYDSKTTSIAFSLPNKLAA